MLSDIRLSLLQLQEPRDFVVLNKTPRSISHRFLAGEKLEEAILVARDLQKRGIRVALARLGEYVEDESVADATVQNYIDALDQIVQAGLDGQLSCKPTSLGLNLSQDLCECKVEAILQHAQPGAIFMSLDMESSVYTSSILAMTTRMHQRFEHVGTVIQAYLHRSEYYLEELLSAGIRIRLVKGSHKEPASIAFQNKSDIDRSYVQLMYSLLAHGNYPAIATHDEAIIQAACTYVREHGISKSAFEFQMLYGIRQDLQQRLAQQGYSVRVYVPYGTHWYPYLMRRMAEYPANLSFFMNRT